MIDIEKIIAWIKQLEFANPQWFWALLIIPLLIAYSIFKNLKKQNSIIISDTKSQIKFAGKGKASLIHIPLILRTLSISLIIITLARPQSSLSWQDVTTEGIDIVIAQDISISMLARDFKPDRLEAAKKLASEFITNRPTDRIGLTIFAGEGFTQCPLTTDHAVLKNLMNDIQTGMLADGTAIGMGLATAINRIKESKAKSRVVILLTDGENNAGNIAPQTASEIAKAFGIRVYTIGLGSKGKAYSPIGKYPNGDFAYDYIDVSIDEKLLKEIAKETGGKYFRATSNNSLKDVYQEIDRLEKSKIEVTEYRKRKEEFLYFLVVAISLLIIEFIFSKMILKGII
jgi:Ca-activated chloride channel family protein